MRIKSFSKNIGFIPCRECGQIKTRLRAELDSFGKWVYREDNGKKWNRLQCYECAKNYARKIGISKPRHLLIDHKNKLGFQSEIKVKQYFEKLGFKVTQTTCHGPDLILEKNGLTITCEVKTACLSHSNCWFVTPVYPKRTNDELIAIVLPNDRIHIEKMRDHLEFCSKSGRRSITTLIRDTRSTKLST